MPKIIDDPEDVMSTAHTVLISTKLKRLIRERAKELGISQGEYTRRLIQRDLNESGNE